MSTPATRSLLAVLIAGLMACSQPSIEKAGGNKGGSGGDGGSGGSDEGGGGGSKKDAGFNVDFPDAGLPQGGAGGGSGPNVDDKTCASEVHKGKLVPLDLLLLLDISGSMEEKADTQSKWRAMHDAVASFLEDPMSAGLGVGMETFPPPSKTCAKDADCGGGSNVCEEKGVCNTPANVATTEPACDAAKMAMCSDEVNPCTKYGICSKSGLRCPTVGMPCAGMAGDMCGARPKFCVVPNAGCDAMTYQTPIVGIADLPGNTMTLEKAMDGITPEGTTPTTPAVTGALAYLKTRAMMNPDRKAVLVLATDGLPTECGINNTVNGATMVIGGAQMAMPSIPTYVIGIFGSNQLDRSGPALAGMATAGGTGMPFLLTTNANLTQQFLSAINQIRGAALGCEFNLPAPNNGAALNFDKVNVQLKVAGTVDNLGYAGNVMGCDPMRGGWYYDTDPKVATPTRVILCDASCKKVKMPGSSVDTSVELQVGCKTNVIR